DRTPHAGQPCARLEHRADARAIPLTCRLERAESLELRALGHIRQARVAERHLRSGQVGFELAHGTLEPLAFDTEHGERRQRAAMRGLEGGPLGGQLQGLGLGGCTLLCQTLAAARQLRAALAQLTSLSHEIDAFAGNPDLLQAQRLETITVTAEHLAV